MSKQSKNLAGWCLIVSLFACASVLRVRAQEERKPIGATELMALVAGGALPENIVHAIAQDGLAFQADDAYQVQLKDAGADASVVAALGQARTVPGSPSLTQADRDLLARYVSATAKIKAKDYQGASDELTTVLKGSFDQADAGFVMGASMRTQKHYPEAAAIYSMIVAKDPEYPSAEAKLASVESLSGDDEGAVRDAKTALAQYKDDAEAHKDLCLAYGNMNEFDAAIAECKESLRLKPDYEAAAVDLGMALDDGHQEDDAIAAFKKAEVLDPSDALAPYDMGLAYEHKHDLSNAIAAYRKAVELDPTRFDARMNLGGALESMGMYADAVTQMRQLEQMYPDSEMCHFCFGNAYYGTGDFDNAEKEYRIAIQMDPADAQPHAGIANMRWVQRRYDEALQEVRIAEKLDPSYVYARRVAGNILLAQAKYDEAAEDLQAAEELQPSDALIHDLYGQALRGKGDNTAAIEEFKESLELAPGQAPVALRLAGAYETTGDWVNAMTVYRKAAETQAGGALLTPMWRGTSDDPQKAYEDAQKRFDAHIAELTAAGKSAEASALEAKIATTSSSASLSDKLNQLMQSGIQVYQQGKVEEAAQDFRDAAVIGRQIQPHDPRLITALEYAGNSYLPNDFTHADTLLEEALKVAEEIYGPGSPKTEEPLNFLGTSALLEKNYPAAEKFYFRIVDIESKYYGESSDRVAMALVSATRVYMAQGQFDKAEPYLLRSEHLLESVYGTDSTAILYPLGNLCYIYDKQNLPEKAEPCYARSLAIMEKQYGDSSPQIASSLTADAAQLRKLGKADQADKLEKQAASLRSSTMGDAPSPAGMRPLSQNN